MSNQNENNSQNPFVLPLETQQYNPQPTYYQPENIQPQQQYYGQQPQQQYYGGQQPYYGQQPQYLGEQTQQQYYGQQQQPYYIQPQQQQQYSQPVYVQTQPQVYTGTIQQPQIYSGTIQQPQYTTTTTTTTTQKNNSQNLELVEENIDKKPLDFIFGNNDGCIVKQKTDFFEIISGFEMENKYDVHMSNGYKLVALEASDCLGRQYCKSRRGFKMHIYDQNKKEVLLLVRPWVMYFPFIEVYDSTVKPPRYIGKVLAEPNFFTREFSVMNSQNKEIFRLQGGVCFLLSWHYKIMDLSGSTVGQIQKQFSGFIKEFYTDSDNFGVKFPDQASSDVKSLLFGATFLIDFMYFEGQNKNNKNRNNQGIFGNLAVLALAQNNDRDM